MISGAESNEQNDDKTNNLDDIILCQVTDPVACVASMPPKYQHIVSSLGSEE